MMFASSHLVPSHLPFLLEVINSNKNLLVSRNSNKNTETLTLYKIKRRNRRPSENINSEVGK